MKRLTLIRHAKASWDADKDFDRTLHKRGLEDAPEMGRRIHNAGLYPDCIRSSSATRALQTANLVIASLGYAEDKIVEDNAIYNAETETLLTTVKGQADSCQHVLLVGHNPGMTELCNQLGEKFRIDDLPTCSVITFDFDIHTWSTISNHSGKLVFFDYPSNKQPINKIEAS